MKLTRQHRSLIAWILYSCVLFSSFVCSIGHGQMAGLRLSGLETGYCVLDGGMVAISLDGEQLLPVGSAGAAGCLVCSTFSALLIAALFGLLGLLPVAGSQRLSFRADVPPPRFNWPSANPRDSPFVA